MWAFQVAFFIREPLDDSTCSRCRYPLESLMMMFRGWLDFLQREPNWHKQLSSSPHPYWHSYPAAWPSSCSLTCPKRCPMLKDEQCTPRAPLPLSSVQALALPLPVPCGPIQGQDQCLLLQGKVRQRLQRILVLWGEEAARDRGNCHHLPPCQQGLQLPHATGEVPHPPGTPTL